ncbi:MAG: hypothetical protein ACTHMW_11140, partial [Actinomycetes bacterium]
MHSWSHHNHRRPHEHRVDRTLPDAPCSRTQRHRRLGIPAATVVNAVRVCTPGRPTTTSVHASTVSGPPSATTWASPAAPRQD